jgi:hypothetical protein
MPLSLDEIPDASQLVEEFTKNLFAFNESQYSQYNISEWHNYSFEEITWEELLNSIPSLSIEPQEGHHYYRLDKALTFASGDYVESVQYYEMYLDEDDNMKINHFKLNTRGEVVKIRDYTYIRTDLPEPWTNGANIPDRVRANDYPLVVGEVGNYWAKMSDMTEYSRNSFLEELSWSRLNPEIIQNGLKFCVLGAEPAWVAEHRGFMELLDVVYSWLDGEIEWEEVEDFVYSESLHEQSPRVSEFAQYNFGCLAGETFDVTNPDHRTLFESYMVFQVWRSARKAIPDIASNVYEVELILAEPLTEAQRNELIENEFWILEENGDRVVVQNTGRNYLDAFSLDKDHEVPLTFVLDTVTRPLSVIGDDNQ